MNTNTNTPAASMYAGMDGTDAFPAAAPQDELSEDAARQIQRQDDVRNAMLLYHARPADREGEAIVQAVFAALRGRAALPAQAVAPALHAALMDLYAQAKAANEEELAGANPVFESEVAAIDLLLNGDLVTPAAPVQDVAPTDARLRDPNHSLLAYVLQGDMHNRLTPRVIDIAYTAFMAAKQPNSEDGGPSDWFTDTKPAIVKAIELLSRDLFEAAQPAAQPADAQDAARYRLVRRGQHWSVVDGIGDTLRAEALDVAVDTELARTQGGAT